MQVRTIYSIKGISLNALGRVLFKKNDNANEYLKEYFKDLFLKIEMNKEKN